MIEGIRRRSSALLTVLCTAIALCAPLTSAADASTGGTGSIEGEITALGGAPLAQVWACAYLVQSGEFEENCDFTGSDGLYAIKGLKAGAYKVEFWSEATEPSYVGEYYDDQSFCEEADEVEVEEGVAKTGIDAELAEGATIKGEIRAASLGGPVDAVACARLSTGELQGCALTQEDGSYALPGLPAGEYKISFTPSSVYNLLNQYFDHKPEPVEANLLTVAVGETKTGIDADLEAGSEVHGTVYSAASGVPVPKTWVCALFMEEAEEGWWPKECARTSAEGKYELIALPTTSYKVVFSPELKEFFGEEEEREDDGYFTQYFNNKPTLAAADLLELTAPEVRTGVDGHLQPEHRASLPSLPVTSPPIVTPKKHRHKPAARCRPGFRRKKVSGKRRCVKIHKHHRRGHSKSA